MDPKMLFMLQNMAQQQPDQQQINPMMLGMMNQQPIPQQYEQIPQQGGIDESPLMRGASSARQMLGITDQQQRRALGMAMMNFFSNMSKPSYRDRSGFNGALSRANESFLPAAEEYWDQHDQALAQNQEEAQLEAAEMRRAEDIERARQKESMQQDRWEREFEETQRSHRANEEYRLRGGKLSAKEKEKLIQEENIEKANQEGALSFDIYPKASLTKKINAIETEIGNAGVYNQTIQVINDMKSIFEEFPDISNDWAQLIVDPDKKPSIFSLGLRNFGNQKKIAALEKLQKYQATLNLDVIFGKSGVRPTDMLKKLIQASNPGGKLTYDAAIKLLNDVEQIAEKKRKNIPIYIKSLSERMFFPTNDVKEIYQKYGFESDSPLNEVTHIPTESKEKPSNNVDEDALELQRIDEQLRKKRGVS